MTRDNAPALITFAVCMLIAAFLDEPESQAPRVVTVQGACPKCNEPLKFNVQVPDHGD